MSIRNRIEKLECQNDSVGTGLVVLQTLFSRDSIRAHIIWGRSKSLTVEREKDETQNEFETRVEDVGKLSWEKASEGRA